ncbi:helix-turn-helix domain-containing protein [Streptococcus uberis]|uniref:helix-turn-helix domain-containing protein n=1 Tax=Streptococcus uberis TaxID=1349 RepID=UPI0020BF900A|nr:helix-turn-helix transcriptional regulator [Streptococcus uberis]
MNRIKELRQERGLTQTQLANLVNAHKGSVCNWEKRNNPNPERAKVLAEYFGVSVKYLLGKSDISEVEKVVSISKKRYEQLLEIERLHNEQI